MKKRYIYLILFGLFVTSLSFSTPALEISDCDQNLLFNPEQVVFKPEELGLYPINENTYTNSRRLIGDGLGQSFNSERMLGPQFLVDLFSLSPGEIYLDGGAGIFRAIFEYFKVLESPEGSRQSLIQMGLLPPDVPDFQIGTKAIGIVNEVFEDTDYLEEIQSLVGTDQFWPILGIPVEDVNDIPKESVSLISDVYGAFSYSGQPDQVIAKYLSWLKPGGKIYIKMHPNAAYNLKISFSTWQMIRGIFNSGQASRNLKAWIEGFECTEIETLSSGRIVLKKNSQPCRVQKLESLSYREDSPPGRKFLALPDFY